MFIKKTRHSIGGVIKTQIRLVESYRPGKGASPKQRVIEDLGWLEDQDDPDAFLRQLQERCSASRNSDVKPQIRLNPDKAIHDNLSAVMNYAPALLEKIYDLLELPDFFRQFRSSKALYDLDRIFLFLVAMRCILPDSKRATFSYIRHVYNWELSFELEDVYRALDEISSLRFDLQRWINIRLNEIFDVDGGHIFFDNTNFYFEKDYSVDGTLPQRGVSKEHQVTPIVQSALMLDSCGNPVLTEAFPGNTSEKLMLKPMVEKAIEMGIIKERTVVVADKGINSGPNKEYLVNHGHGFLFSQVLKGKAGKRYREKMLEPDGWVGSFDAGYRYKLYEEEYTDKDSEGVKSARKQLVLIYWNRERSERDRRSRETKIQRAQKKLTNNAYTLTHGADEYLKNEIVDEETGEVRKAEVITSLNTDKISEDELYDGYQCLITSELDYTEGKIRSCYHKLWMIEQSYRIEKSDLETRPIYVRLDERIRGHLTVCHMSLVFMRLIQQSMGREMVSAERIRRVLNQCQLITPQQGTVMLLDPSQKVEYAAYIGEDGTREYTTIATEEDEVLGDYEKVMAGFGVELTRDSKAVYRKEDFDRLIKKAKLPIMKGRTKQRKTKR